MLDKILQTLMFKKKVKSADLARQTNIPKQTLSRIISGKCKNPHAKNLQPLANYFDVSVNQLKGDEALPSELVDIQLPNSKPKAKAIPVLSMADFLAEESTTTKETENSIYADHDFSEQAFAVKMPDASMEPIFRKDTLLIFEPKGDYSDHHYVFVRLAESKQVIFRQLITDADTRFFRCAYSVNRMKFLVY
jgi:transcriptional regulator with XRE-family HTH domain